MQEGEAKGSCGAVIKCYYLKEKENKILWIWHSDICAQEPLASAAFINNTSRAISYHMQNDSGKCIPPNEEFISIFQASWRFVRFTSYQVTYIADGGE